MSVAAKLLYCEIAELLPCLEWRMSILKSRYEIILAPLLLNEVCWTALQVEPYSSTVDGSYAR